MGGNTIGRAKVTPCGSLVLGKKRRHRRRRFVCRSKCCRLRFCVGGFKPSEIQTLTEQKNVAFVRGLMNYLFGEPRQYRLRNGVGCRYNDPSPDCLRRNEVFDDIKSS